MNSRYSMLVQWSDEDQAYVVTFPEFSTCHTHGATYEEAVRNGQEVVGLLLETYRLRGQPVPAPLTFEYAYA